jgi:hypothetical protein
MWKWLLMGGFVGFTTIIEMTIPATIVWGEINACAITLASHNVNLSWLKCSGVKMSKYK